MRVAELCVDRKGGRKGREADEMGNLGFASPSRREANPFAFSDASYPPNKLLSDF